MFSRKQIYLVAFSLILAPAAVAQYIQQGNKLVGSGALGASQGWAVALSGDGNTAIVGGPTDGFPSLGSVWFYTRANGVWTQQGNRLAGTGAVTNAFSGVNQGFAVSLSNDGNTALVGGYGDNNGAGAVWIFTRTNAVWTQQGGKLTANDGAGASYFGYSVSLSADGNTAIVGGNNDNSGVGAAWIFTRSGTTWTQVGNKLAGAGSVGPSRQGSVAISGDGKTAIVGGYGDNGQTGASWIYTNNNGAWTPQGAKLTGSDSTGTFAYQGISVALSNDGNTAIVGGYGDNGGIGALWAFTRTGGVWTQQGNKLIGTGYSGTVPLQGFSVALSADGNTAISGAWLDSGALGGNVGAFWVFKRSSGVWSQQGGKLVGTGGVPSGAPSAHGQGHAVAISADASTIIEGSPGDNNGPGAVWVFVLTTVTGTAPVAAGPGAGNLATGTMTFTFNDSRGWEDLDVVNVLINNFLDGRNACYIAYSRPSAVLYLVADAGGGLSPGLVLGGSGSVSNGQCTITAAGSSASGGGNTLTLTLNITFTAAFGGNKVTYLAARDLQGGNSGWQALGTWSVPGSTATFPVAAGVSPSRGTGSAATFTFTFTDTKGFQDLGVVNILINNFLDGRQACYLAYSRPAGVLYLVNDEGGLSGLPLNGSGAVTNSQCTVNGAGSSATGAGNTLTLVLNLSFKSAFNGNRVIYLAARDTTDANNSGWQSLGSWSVQ